MEPPGPPPRNLTFFYGTCVDLTYLYIYFERREKLLASHLCLMFMNKGVKSVSWLEEGRQDPYTFRLIIDTDHLDLKDEIELEIKKLASTKDPFLFVEDVCMVPLLVASKLQRKSVRNTLQAHFLVTYTWDSSSVDENYLALKFQAVNIESCQKFKSFLGSISINNAGALRSMRNLTMLKTMALFVDVSGINTGVESSVYNTSTDFVSLKGAHFLELVVHGFKLASSLVFSNKWVPEKGKFKYFVDFLNKMMVENKRSYCDTLAMEGLSYTDIENQACLQVKKYLECECFSFVLGEDNENDKAFLEGKIGNHSTYLDDTIQKLLNSGKVVDVWFWKFFCTGKYFYLRRRFGSYTNFRLHPLEDLKASILFTSPRIFKGSSASTCSSSSSDTGSNF